MALEGTFQCLILVPATEELLQTRRNRSLLLFDDSRKLLKVRFTGIT
jgi:hypothetical protein